MKTRFLNLRFLAKLIVLGIVVQLASPAILHAQFMNYYMDVSLGLQILPTTVVVTPVSHSTVEGGSVIQYTATAKYNYPGLITPIPDKNVTNDPTTVWTSSNPGVALVDTIGKVTPVSDLNTGSANSTISAVYAGLTGQAVITVTGQVVSPPGGGSIGGGGGGGGIAGGDNPPGGDGDTGDTGDTGDIGDGDGDTGETGDIGDDEGDTVETVDIGDDEGDTGETGDIGDGDGDTGETGDIGDGDGDTGETGAAESASIEQQIRIPYVRETVLPPEEPVVPEQVLPMEEVFTPEELETVEPGLTRAYVTAKIASDLGVLNLRKDVLDKCYADLENCTAIFRMFSSYDGISLDADNLVLFPDLEGVPEQDEINKMALLGIIQGYYGIENSPFLPDKSISKIESLKVIATILSTLEKGKPDYVQPAFDFNSLFYQEIYESSLLYTLDQTRMTFNGSALPVASIPGVRLAHALTQEGLRLIKAQTTPFIDIRPDLYDSHWYYPIVIGKLCEEKIIDCQKDSELNPDVPLEYGHLKAFLRSANAFIEEESLNTAALSDADDDGILNIDENLIYLTNPQVSDTDTDALNDGDEILEYGTDPNKADTDGDGLSDGEEVKVYKTDPRLYDTDEDTFSDFTEVNAGSDPLDARSVPVDINENGVSDDWEVQYNVDVVDGSQDTDGDGISDVLEYIYGTNPIQIDSDMDGFTDSEEILSLLTDPNNPNDPGTLDDLPVIINNFQYGQIVADSSPMIKGVGPASLGDNVVAIQILLRNEFGNELMLGQTKTDAKGGFIFVPDIEINNGTYFLLARSLNRGQVKMSTPLKIIVDNTLQVASAKPEKLENVPIDEEVLIKKLVLKVDSTDGRPVLYGTLSEFGSRVNVTWQSLVVSSALIADTTDGSFSMKAPVLEDGRHVVYLQTVRKRDNALSKTIKISFDLGRVDKTALRQGEGEEGGTLEKGAIALRAAAVGLVGFVTQQSWPFWIVIVVILVIAGGVIYVFFWGENSDRKKKK